MTNAIASLTDYQDWRNTIKQRVVSARLRVALASKSIPLQFSKEAACHEKPGH